jgi:excisionase family DNA binding protein
MAEIGRTGHQLGIFVRRQFAADAIGVSLPTLDRMIRAGQVQIVRVGRRVLVRRESLERLEEIAKSC